MPLAGGTRFGPYEILAPIGAGGMGEVYKGRDTRLDRTVAIKVLPSHIADREEFRLRFEHEARAVSRLNHPHICVLYDIGRESGTSFMVMEHLEGETLADRLQRGSLPVEQAVKYASEIGDAVDRAHRSGVVHRDLKPGNIMLTRDGAKVLDFGLAKTVGAARTAVAAESTLTVPLTSEGTVLGTPQYMAPEQIEGLEADARTDVFAFGCVLYEMVTGAPAFNGKSKAGVAAAILAAEPTAMTALQPVTPPALECLVKQCLAKDREERWQSLRDVVLQLRSIGNSAGSTPREAAKRAWLPWAMSGAFTALAASLAFIVFSSWTRAPVTDMPAARFLVTPPADTRFSLSASFTAVSRDGRYVAFVAGNSQPPVVQRLWVRPLDSLSAAPVPGSEGALAPFWSPDGKSLGFYAGGKLKRSDIAGGAPMVLCDAEGNSGQGGTWSHNGVILFGTKDGIYRVPASGGVPQQVTKPDRARKETFHGVPLFLPDGSRFLYLVESTDPNVRGVYAASLDNPANRVRILETERKAYYAPPLDGRSGFLMFVREQTLLAQRFDAEKLRLEGEPIRLAESVGTVQAQAQFWVSDTGLLAYRANSTYPTGKLIWIGRDGKELGEVLKEDRYSNFRLSPDGTRLAVARVSDDSGTTSDIWIFEFGRHLLTRLTLEGFNSNPLWSGDGRDIVYYSRRSGTRGYYRKAVDGSGREEQVITGADSLSAFDWSRDGAYVLYSTSPSSAVELRSIWALPLTGDRKTFEVFGARQVQNVRFSPDGKWIAYDSAGAGRSEVFIQSFPDKGSKWQVSNNGGGSPRWNSDGKELFYWSRDRGMMAATVRIAGATVQIDSLRQLFRVPTGTTPSLTWYEVSPDGQRFLGYSRNQNSMGAEPLTVVTNWQAALKK